MKTGVNVYSFRELEEPVAETTDRIVEAGYDGIQYAGDIDALDESLAATLDEGGVEAIPFHVGADVLETEFDAVVETCEVLDASGVVVPWAGPEVFESRATVEEFADSLAALDDRLDAEGLELHFHNHHREFEPLPDGALGVEIIAERTDASFELDVGWVHAAGEAPAEWLRRLEGRCSLVHMKDVRVEPWEGNPARPVEIGTGDVDFQACAEAASEVGVEWLTYEHDIPEDPLESLAAGIEYLRAL